MFKNLKRNIIVLWVTLMLEGRNVMERKSTQELVKYENRITADQHCHLSHVIREPVDNIIYK